MAKVLAIQHNDFETIGTIEAVLSEKHINVHCIRPFAGDPVPQEIGDYCGVIVMGGPMGVYECDRYPFLADEIKLITLAMQDCVPLLGICLGSQLIAAALGSNVAKGKALEIGWHNVYLTEASNRDPLWREIESPLMGFHWHGDIFEAPDGAVSLARSEQTDCQAFRYGDTTYGILFHMEVTERIVSDVVDAFPEELREVGLGADQIVMDNAGHLSQLQAVGKRVFTRWSELIAG